MTDLQLGATGEFPEGKLLSTDEGELQFLVGVVEGNVVVRFGTPVAWLGLPPQQAADLASLIIRHARHAAIASGTAVRVSL